VPLASAFPEPSGLNEEYMDQATHNNIIPLIWGTCKLDGGEAAAGLSEAFDEVDLAIDGDADTEEMDDSAECEVEP
jgi:hypothetical protein